MARCCELSSRFLLIAIGVLSASTLLVAAEHATPAQVMKAGAPETVSATCSAQKTNDAAIPTSRPESSWMRRHESMNERVKQGNADLLFIGDSITQAWEGSGKEVWEKYYAKRNAVNLGISGDRTQHVLWRLEHGNIDGIKPKLAVIMIGTNNSERNSVAEIIEGIRKIVNKLRDNLPETKILLLAIFPRGEQPNARRGDILQVNQVIANLDDGKNVHYLDIGSRFISDDGSLSREIMKDFLHLTPKGYQIWADAIEAKVAELMGEK